MVIYVIITLFLMISTFLITRMYYISCQKKDNKTIEELTIIDSETGLYNRTFFDKYYLSEFHKAQRINHPIALLFLETIDVKEVSKILTQSIKRDTDFVSRFCDNIFVVVMYNTNADGVDPVIKRVMDNLKKEITLNIGVHTGIPDSHTSSRNLIDEAFKALEKSKNRGNKTIEFSLNSI